MAWRIIVDAETPGDPRTMFRVLIDDKPIQEGLTAVQAHILVGDILESIAKRKPAGRKPTAKG